MRGASTGRVALFAIALTMVAQGDAIAQAQPDRVANPAAGQLAPRQRRGQAEANIRPVARIDNRIPSRIELRIRNRIDRDYNPQADPTQAFATAGDQTQKAVRASGR